jgi:hypothetical protein
MKDESAIGHKSSALLHFDLRSLSNVWLIAASGTQRGSTPVCQLRPFSGSSSSSQPSKSASKRVAATMGDSSKPLRYVDVCLALNSADLQTLTFAISDWHQPQRPHVRRKLSWKASA